MNECPHGHVYDEANTYVDRWGGRRCRACRRAQMKARYVPRERRPPKPVIRRMMGKFLVGDGCWEWRASRRGYGYGEILIGPGKKKAPAHRVMYEYFVGPIPEGLELDHLCENPRCVRPDHLEPVTHSENGLRSFRRQHDDARI